MLLCQSIGTNRPYLRRTVPIFYAIFPTVPIFLDFVPIFLKSLMLKKQCHFVSKFGDFDHFSLNFCISHFFMDFVPILIVTMSEDLE